MATEINSSEDEQKEINSRSLQASGA